MDFIRDYGIGLMDAGINENFSTNGTNRSFYQCGCYMSGTWAGFYGIGSTIISIIMGNGGGWKIGVRVPADSSDRVRQAKIPASGWVKFFLSSESYRAKIELDSC